MKNFKSVLTAIFALVLGVGGTGAYLGYTGNDSGVIYTVYGSETGTTAVSSTSKILRTGSSNGTINLNIKTSSTAVQTIAVVPEYSNDSADCATAVFFRETVNAASGGAVTVSTSTRTIQVPVGIYYQNIQIQDMNSECLKLTLTASSSTLTSLLWAEAIAK